MNDMTNLLHKPEFPRSNGYEQAWMLENQMGPNSVWLAEWLARDLPLARGMKVLDLGCGRAMSSIFLAKEYEVQVWAADLWITPDHNWKRVQEAGVGHSVFPLRLEAHALPFPEGFFDAIVSMDAYHYFGTDILYLGYVGRFLRPGGTIGIVVPGLMQEIKVVPSHLSTPQKNGKIFWENECWSFKTAEWWRELWQKSGRLTDIRVDTQPDGWRHWRDFERAIEASGKSIFPSDAEALEADQGRYVGFVRAIATRIGNEAENLYDAALGARAGVDT